MKRFSNLQRCSDFTYEPVQKVQVHPLGRMSFVTVFSNASGNLKLTAWHIDRNGKIFVKGSATAGRAYVFEACTIGNNHIVTAVKTEMGTMKLIAWHVSDAGVINRQGSAETGAVKKLSVAAIGSSMLVTAITDDKSRLKLISWSFSNSGTFTRLKDRVSEIALDVDVCRVPMGNSRFIVTAVHTNSSQTKLTAWSIDQSGAFNKKSSVNTRLLYSSCLASVSYGRVALAGTDNTGKMHVHSTRVGDDGAVDILKTGHTGVAKAVDITAQASTRVVTAVRQESGSLKLISWDTVDGIERLGSAVAGGVWDVSVCTLGNDKIISAVKTPGGSKLKLILWNEHALSLLKGRWGKKPTFKPREKLAQLNPATRAEPRAELRRADSGPEPSLKTALAELQRPIVTKEAYGYNVQLQSPPPSLVYPHINWSADDVRFAVGTKAIVIVSGGGSKIEFRDRSCNILQSKYGENTTLSTGELFGSFRRATTANGKLNEHNINLHLNRPTHIAYYNDANINVFYDVRVHFDHYAKRFIIACNSRHQGLSYGNDDDMSPKDHMVRRYLAFAVSVSEDPRDGFHTYISTEYAFLDWPRITAVNGLLMLTHRGSWNEKDGVVPSCRILELHALSAGNRFAPCFKTYPDDVPNGDVVPVNHYGDTRGFNHILKTSGSTVTVYSFKTPVDFKVLPEIHQSSVSFSAPRFTSIRTPPVFRNDKLHFVCVKSITPRVLNVRPGRYSVRLMRMAFRYKAITQEPIAQGPGTPGFIDTWFGRSALEDSPGDLVSYEVPIIAANKHGHMLIAYGRTGVETENELHPEARYSIFYDDYRALYRSRLVQAGDFTPTKLHELEDQMETTPTAITHNEVFKSLNADVDPIDEETLWMIHGYGDSSLNDYNCVIGKVKP
ncbi:MAG: hypothetical protein GQ565_09345 [Candidatus Aegiribacteria sp.]|nr:hypothetical protein [Candidatus Aegiribacteria sp.]